MANPTSTPAETVADEMRSKPALWIGFPIWAALRSGANCNRLSGDEFRAYMSRGLIIETARPVDQNPSNAEAARGLGFDGELTDLGREVAALLA